MTITCFKKCCCKLLYFPSLILLLYLLQAPCHPIISTCRNRNQISALLWSLELRQWQEIWETIKLCSQNALALKTNYGLLVPYEEGVREHSAQATLTYLPWYATPQLWSQSRLHSPALRSWMDRFLECIAPRSLQAPAHTWMAQAVAHLLSPMIAAAVDKAVQKGMEQLRQLSLTWPLHCKCYNPLSQGIHKTV